VPEPTEEPAPAPAAAAPVPAIDFSAPLIRDGAIHGLGPADGAPLPPVALTPLEDIPAIVARARVAQAAYAHKDVEERVALLRRLQDAVMARGEALAATIVAETGKPEAEAWLHEVVPTADLGAYWCGDAVEHLASHEPELDALSYPGKRALTERVPRGVVALITPWNFPAALPLRTLFPALLAGDAVVLKPSEQTPRTGAILVEAAREVYGPDLVALVQGAGDAGRALIAGGVDAVVFTGSVSTGKKVAHAAADALLPVSHELGGKDAAVVLEDADVERAARGILWGAVVNSGQNCAAVERVIAVEAIAGKLEARLAELVKELVPGRDFGPMTTPAQKAIVERHVEGARAAGARVVAGGEPIDRPGLWVAPALIAGAPSDGELVADETFGPVIPILRVASEEAAIEAANASRYGLTASVWTKDLERGERVARRLRAGVVMVNNHGFTGAVPSLPWSGVGESGYGVTNSPHALDILTRPRALIVDSSRGKREMWWHPYTPSLVKIGRAMATLRRPRAGIFAKAKAFFSLLSAFVTRWKV
jgi:acyl-CoA reductase-like NAD-dependent aldehyde dehydrogenase